MIIFYGITGENNKKLKKKSNSDVDILDYQLDFYIMATVLDTISKIGRFFKIFWSLCPEPNPWLTKLFIVIVAPVNLMKLILR